MSALSPMLALGDEAPDVPDDVVPLPAHWPAAYAAWCATHVCTVVLTPSVERARWMLFAGAQLLIDQRAACATEGAASAAPPATSTTVEGDL